VFQGEIVPEYHPRRVPHTNGRLNFDKLSYAACPQGSICAGRVADTTLNSRGIASADGQDQGLINPFLLSNVGCVCLDGGKYSGCFSDLSLGERCRFGEIRGILRL
jgi:hypothetical protein